MSINANYPGASAKVVQDSVAQLIEQNMKGLDGLLYFSSTSEGNGNATIELTFANGTNPDTAQVQVQNKLALATPLLPQEVQRQGVNRQTVRRTADGKQQTVNRQQPVRQTRNTRKKK